MFIWSRLNPSGFTVCLYLCQVFFFLSPTITVVLSLYHCPVWLGSISLDIKIIIRRLNIWFGGWVRLHSASLVEVILFKYCFKQRLLFFRIIDMQLDTKFKLSQLFWTLLGVCCVMSRSSRSKILSSHNDVKLTQI